MVVEGEGRQVARAHRVLIEVAAYEGHGRLVEPVAAARGAVGAEQTPVAAAPVDVSAVGRDAAGVQRTLHPRLLKVKVK